MGEGKSSINRYINKMKFVLRKNGQTNEREKSKKGRKKFLGYRRKNRRA